MGAPVSDDTARAALVAYNEAGNYSAGARLAGYDSRMTFKRHVRAARDRGLHLSEGILGAVETAKLSPGEAKAGWIVDVDQETGSRKSTYWRAPEPEPTDYAEELRGIFEGMEPAPLVPAPERTNDDLCTLYPLMDVHFGMQAWGKETGSDDYGISEATGDLRRAMSKVANLTPNAKQAILIIGGDFFHADDNRSETPANKHKLDTDNRHWKVLQSGIALVVDAVTHLVSKHDTVLVRVLRGNHDEHAHLVLTFALSERYRENDRINIEVEPRDIFQFQWGKTAIFAHHGDKAKAERLTLYLSDICSFWSATRHRYCLTGHVHHDQARDIGPLRWESLRAFCPPDAYAASMGYGARRALQSLTFDKIDGLVLRAIDPIEVAA